MVDMMRLWKMILREAAAYTASTISICIAIMLVAMSKEIVRMAALSGEIATTASFILLQVPYLLPYTIILAAFLSCMAVCRRLSEHGEFTALRSAGFSTTMIVLPLLWWSMLLGLANFIICSELAPVARLRSKLLIENIARQKPLSLLQQDRLLSRNVGWMGNHTSTGGASLAFILERSPDEPLLLLLDQPQQNRALTAPCATLVQPPQQLRDHVLIESSTNVAIDREALANQLLKSPLQDIDDYAAWGHFWHKLHLPAFMQEIVRRLLLAILVPLVGIMGSLYGLSSSRQINRYSSAVATSASLLALLCCVVMRSLPPKVGLFLSVALAPILLIVALAVQRSRQLKRGFV